MALPTSIQEFEEPIKRVTQDDLAGLMSDLETRVFDQLEARVQVL